jgi:hypothetical protein
MPSYVILPDLERYLDGHAQGSIPLMAAVFRDVYEATTARFRSLLGRDPPRAVNPLVMEGIPNGFSAACRWALMQQSGLSYEEVLALKRPDTASAEVVRRAEQVVGTLGNGHVREQWRRLGLLDPCPCWVELDPDEADGNWSVSVCNRGKPCEADVREVQRRMDDPQGARKQIDVLREQYRRPDGRVSIPTTTGGGALGVLHIINMAAKDSLRLEFRSTDGDPPVTAFTVHGSREAPGDRPVQSRCAGKLRGGGSGSPRRCSPRRCWDTWSGPTDWRDSSYTSRHSRLPPAA